MRLGAEKSNEQAENVSEDTKSKENGSSTFIRRIEEYSDVSARSPARLNLGEVA